MSTKNELARITIDLPPELQKKLKTFSVINGISMKELVITAIEKQLKAMEAKTTNILHRENYHGK